MAQTDNLLQKAAPATNDSDRVANWRAQIERARKMLFIQQRGEAANEMDRFVYSPPKEADVAGELDLKYALPILEQSFARASIKVPAPTVIATADAPEGWEEKLRQFLALQFRRHTRELTKHGVDVQWDDARWGACVSKIEWDIRTELADTEQGADEALRATQMERAAIENEDPAIAKLSVGDLHLEHLSVHVPGLALYAGDMERYNALDSHINDHEAQLTTTQSEGVKLKRVNPGQYLYDPDNPWVDRGWEVEEELIRVVDMKAPRSGYRNITTDYITPIIPGEKSGFSGKVPAEALYVKVYHIHDRRENKLYTISASPGEGGKDAFLRKMDWPFPTDIYLLKVFRPFSADLTYGEATLLSLRPILKELAVVQYHIRKHVKMHSTTKFFGLDKAGANKIKAGIKNDEQWWIGMSEAELAMLKWMQPPPIPDTLLVRQAELINEIYRQVQADAQDVGVQNKHAITAQESGRREFTAETRVASRQSVIADIYSWYAVTLVKMYREFAMMKVPISVITPEGKRFDEIDTSEVPDAFEIYVDVRAESDQVKALQVETLFKLTEFALGSQAPVNVDALFDTLFHLAGLDYTKYRMQGPTGPQNVQEVPGQGGSMASENPVMNAPAVQTSASSVTSGKG